VVKVTVTVPEDRVADLHCAAAELCEPKKAEAPAPKDTPDWTSELAASAVGKMSDHEKRLLYRIADARGRVPLSELARDLGLPGQAALEQDFPVLTAFCAGTKEDGTVRPAMPVAVGGSGSDAWYWMAELEAKRLRNAVRRWYTNESAAVTEQPTSATRPASVSESPRDVT
jgi:hypothetical protein